MKSLLFCLILVTAIKCHVVEEKCLVEEYYNDDGEEYKRCY